MGQAVADFANQDAADQLLEHIAGVSYRNIVFKFRPGKTAAPAFGG